jgi:hypothetical protein
MRSKYEATHSWSFQKEFMKLAETDCEIAFGYGIAAHLIQDSVAHNYYVPERIQRYFGPNVPFHPIYELRPEAHIIKAFPNEYTRVQHALNPLMNDEQLMNKLQQAVSKVGQVNVEEEVKRFNDVLGNPDGFYTKAFGIPDIYKSFAYGNRTYGVVLMVFGLIVFAMNFKTRGRVKNVFLQVILTVLMVLSFFCILFGLLFLAGGVAGITTNDDFDYYMDMAIDRSVQIFQDSGWESRTDYDPTGFYTLGIADSKVMGVWIFAGIVVIGLLSFYVYFKLRKRKKK